MDLSKRERYIVIAAVVVLAVLVLDRYVLTPFVGKWGRVSNDRARLSQQLDRASGLFERRERLEARWQEMLSTSLKTDPASAESQVLHALREWSQKSGMTLSSVRPDHVAGGGDLPQIRFSVTCTGSMQSAAAFMWDIETADLPLRIDSMQLSTAREGGRQMSLQVEVSTIYALPDVEDEASTAGLDDPERVRS